MRWHWYIIQPHDMRQGTLEAPTIETAIQALQSQVSEPLPAMRQSCRSYSRDIVYWGCCRDARWPMTTPTMICQVAGG
jgi:hypothetical protein